MPRLLSLLLLACVGCAGGGSGGTHAPKPSPLPPIAAMYEGRTFTGVPGREALEVVGRTVAIRHCRFVGGSTCLRFVDCSNVLVEDCTFERATGPADPDGQCVQLIRSTGTIRRCTFTASQASEDLLSVFADKPVRGVVTVEACTFDGRGDSDSSTSICADGPHCPPLTVSGCTIRGARVGVQLAGGVGHTISANAFSRCAVDVAIQSYYPGPFGSHTVAANKLEHPVQVGENAGAGNKIQR